MPRTDDGEFELILGNRQLLSVFFLVVILLGVFFAMGYVVGRAPGGISQTEVTAARGDGEKTARASEAATSDGGTAGSDAVKPSATEPGPAVKADPLAAKPGEPVKSVAAVGNGGEPQLIDPQPGQVFVQIGATSRAEAFLVAQSVSRKNFPAVVAQIPDTNKYRILVGPYGAKDTAAISKAKADMEALGFNKPFVQKIK